MAQMVTPNIFGQFMQGRQIGLAENEYRSQQEAKNALAQAIQTGGYDSPQALNALARIDPGAAMSLGYQRKDSDRNYNLNLRQFEEGTRRWEEQMKLSRAAAARAAASGNRAAAAAAEQNVRTGIASLVQGMVSVSPEEMPAAYNRAVQAALRAGILDEGALARIPDPRTATPQEIMGLATALGIQPPQGPQPSAGFQALQERADAAGLEVGTPAYQEFMRTGGRVEPSRAIFGPDGQPIFLEGDATTQRFTEQQSKDVVYATRAEGALGVLDQYAPALTNFGDRMLDADPTGLARRQQAPEFQLARQAGDEFLQAILRKDTGAAITTQEQELYGDTYLPRPGDSAAVLAQKQQARRRALEALKAGMGPAQIVAQERAMRRTIDAEASSPSVDDLLRKYSE